MPMNQSFLPSDPARTVIPSNPSSHEGLAPPDEENEVNARERGKASSSLHLQDFDLLQIIKEVMQKYC